MEGNDHVIQQQKLCRVCGNHIVLKADYWKTKSVDEFADALFRVYDIEVKTEDQNVYPKLLCSSCRKKLQNKNTYASLEAARFFKYNSERKICQSKPKPDVAVHMKICEWGYELKVLGRNINLDGLFYDLPRKLTDENVQKVAAKLQYFRE